ncbi:serine/threonine-protein phosphatase [Streptomyces tanashiensis]
MDVVEAVAVVIGAFREAAEQERTLEGVAQRLVALTLEGTRRDGLDAFEGFTTAVLAEIPRSDGSGTFDGFVRVVNRGHPPPLMLYADGRLETLEPGEAALPLGMGELGGVLPGGGASLPAGRDAALLHGRPLGGAVRAGALLRSGGAARRADLPGTRGAARRARGRRTAPHGRRVGDMALLAVSRPATGQPERRRTMPVVPPEGSGHQA